MGKYKIYGDPISGNCLKVRWTADLLGVSYDWIDVDVLSGYTRSEEFLAINPSGQVPAIVLPDGRSLSQSNAIVLYLASLYDSALVPKDLFERAKVNEWLFWEQYSHEPYIAVRRFQKAYLGKSDSELDPRLLTNGKRALAQMSDQLSRTPFLAGENLTVADIALVAYTRVAHEGGFDLDEFPNLRSWVARVESALGVDPVGGAA